MSIKLKYFIIILAIAVGGLIANAAYAACGPPPKPDSKGCFKIESPRGHQATCCIILIEATQCVELWCALPGEELSCLVDEPVCG